MEECRLILADISLWDEKANKWLVAKKEINGHREYEVESTAIVAAEAEQMEVEQVRGIAATKQAAQMVSCG